MSTHLKFMISSFVLALLINPQLSQAQQWEWSKTLESSGNCKVNGVTSDREGNTVIAGTFSGSVAFNTTAFTSEGGQDIFIAKYNQNGDLLWATQAGGPDEQEVFGLTSDKDGNIFITGYFLGGLNLGHVSLENGIDLKDKNCIVMKYNKDGAFMWALRSNGAGDKYGKAITADKDGNIFFTGVFTNEISFFYVKEHPGAAERGEHEEDDEDKPALKSKSASNIFIAKVVGDTEFLWIKQSDGAGINEPSGIETDNQGNCYITGSFSGECVFDSTSIKSEGGKDIFLTKYDSKGKVIWAKRAGGSLKDDQGSDIARGSDNHIYLTGYFSGPASFGKKKLKCLGDNDLFIAKTDLDGNTVWAKRAGGEGSEYSKSIELDSEGNIYVAGGFNGSFNFTKNKISNSGDWDIFVLKLNNRGKMINAYHAGGMGSDKGIGMTVNAQSNCFVLGAISQEARFDGIQLKNKSSHDIFIAKIKE